MKIAAIDFTGLEAIASPLFVGRTLGGLVSRILTYLFPIAGFILLIFLILGGYEYMFSKGDPKAIQQAQAKVTTALVGFIIIFVSYWLVQLLGQILGINLIQVPTGGR